MNYAAAAGSQAPVTEFGYIDEGGSTAWESLAALGLIGLLFVPVALLVVWLFHRLFRNQSSLLSATLAAVTSVMAFSAIRLVNGLLFRKVGFAEAAATALEWDDPFFATVIGVIFAFSWLSAIWLARRLYRRANPKPSIETFE